jgi:drug/metabolite transporter (DMT)-like permease
VTYGLIAALAWGISTIAAAWAARRVGTYMALLVSQLLGAGFLGLLAVMMRPSLAGLDGLTLPGLAGAGLLCLLGWLTYYKALEDGPVGVVSAIAATYGGVAAVLAVLVLGERLGLSGGAGVILAVGGVGLAAAQSRHPPGLAAGGVARSGILLAVVAAATYGVGSFLLGGFSAQVGWLAAALVAYGSSVAALVLVLPFRRAGNGRPGGAAPPPDFRQSANCDGEPDKASGRHRPGYLPGLGWAAAAGLAEAVALAAFSRGGEAGQVAVTAAVSSLYPIIPLAAGLMVFHERLRWRQVLGVACIIAGLVMISVGQDAMGTMLARGEQVIRAPLVFMSVILGLAGTVPIVVRVLRGKAGPQPVSWGLRARAGLLKARGDLDGAEQILRDRAGAGDGYAARELAGLLARRGDLNGPRDRVGAGDEHAAFQLARPGPG